MTRLARTIPIVAVCALTAVALACSGGGSTPTTPSASSLSAPPVVAKATLTFGTSSATGYLEPTGGATYAFAYQVQETGGTTGARLTSFQVRLSNGRFQEVPVTFYAVPAGGLHDTGTYYLTEGTATSVMSSLELKLAFTDDGGSVSTVTASIPVTEVPRWMVFGVVRNLSSTPAVGASVTISDALGHLFTTTTDSNGNYSVSNVSQGAARISARTGNSFPVLKDVLIAADTRVDIQMDH